MRRRGWRVGVMESLEVSTGRRLHKSCRECLVCGSSNARRELVKPVAKRRRHGANLLDGNIDSGFHDAALVGDARCLYRRLAPACISTSRRGEHAVYLRALRSSWPPFPGTAVAGYIPSPRQLPSSTHSAGPVAVSFPSAVQWRIPAALGDSAVSPRGIRSGTTSIRVH